MGEPVDKPDVKKAQPRESSESASTQNNFPKFHELFEHPTAVIGQILAGPEAGIRAAKHAFVEKAHGTIQLAEEVANKASNSAIGQDIFSKESLASYGPQKYDQAKPYSYNWYFEQIGAAAPLVVATAVGSRFLGSSAAKSLRSMEKASVNSFILDAHNIATRPSPTGMNLTHSAITGFVSEFVSPITEPTDSTKDSLELRVKNGLNGAGSMAAMSAGSLAVESVVGSVSNSFLKKVAVATVGGGVGGSASYAVDAIANKKEMTFDEFGQSVLGAALVGGTFGAVSGRSRIESKENPIISLIDKEQSGILDTNQAFARAIAKHIKDSEANHLEAFRGIKAADLDLRNFDFGTANLHRVDLSGADLRGADFSQVRKMSFVNFENANLEGAKFSRENMPSAFEPLTGHMEDLNFAGAKLGGADFTNSVITHSNFNKAQLDADTTLDGAYLSNNNFREANLRGVDFRNVRSLLESNFENADIAGANFSGKSLDGAEVRRAKNLDSAILDELNHRTIGMRFEHDPEKKKFIEAARKENRIDFYKGLRLIDRSLTLPESAWDLSSEDFNKAARWSVPQHADTSVLNGKDPYESLAPWERAALHVKLSGSWADSADVRSLGRDHFLQNYASTDQVISMFHPKASEQTLRLIESGVDAAQYATNDNYRAAVRFLKVGEFEKQVATYAEKLPFSDTSQPLLKLVSNLGDNSSRYLKNVEKAWLIEQVEQAKAVSESPQSLPAEKAEADKKLHRLQLPKPELTQQEEYNLLAHATDYLTLHNAPVSGQNSLSDWLAKNVTYQQSEPVRDSDGKAVLDENDKQQFKNTIRMRSKADLQMIASNWESIPEADRAKGNFSKLVNVITSRIYPNAVDASFASEAARGGIKLEDFASAQDRYLKSQSVPSPFPLEKVWHSEDGSLTGRFIPRSDARGIFLGNMTDCCQHPNGPGRQAAWYGQEQPNAGFFVVSDKKGNVVAQSFAWVSSEKGLVFDSIEGKGITASARKAAVIETYKAVSADLASKYHAITVGAGVYAGNAQLVTKTWKAAGSNAQQIPNDLGYTDANVQYILALNGVSK